ncbi:hypothetical protein GCM10027346_24140 [Hymenobacter seoulensis]
MEALETQNARGERMKQLRLNAELTLREAAEAVGLAFSQISKIEKNDTIYIKPSVLKKFADAYKTSPEYIESGKHPKPEQDKPAIMAPQDSARRIPTVQVNFRDIPFLPVRARTSFAELYTDDSYKYEDQDLIPVPGVPDTKEYEEALIIEVDGDSMDQGENSTLRSGARVLVTPMQRDDWQYMPSGVYCFVFRSTFVIKRVKDNTLLSTGMLTLHSDNLKGGTLEVRGEDIRGVWKVRWGVFTPID